jgi:glycosyltransferase involved in cell wall biosynthesis
MGTEELIRVAALTSGRQVPSRRFRVEQHLEPLRAHGVAVSEYLPRIGKYAPAPRLLDALSLPGKAVWHAGKIGARLPGIGGSWRADVTWLERELYSGAVSLEPLLRRPVVLDVDDAIWLRVGETGAARLAAMSSMVVAGNSYLAEWFSRFAPATVVIPTAVDTDRYAPTGEPPEKFTIGWIGSRSTTPYLLEIEDALATAMATIPGAELLVVSDVELKFRLLDPDRVRNITWSRDVECDALAQMSVGLMPLPDTEWTRGKCSFKMLQYMACGIPAVVSPVGANIEVLARGELGVGARSNEEWVDALVTISRDREYAERCGRQGRAVAQQHYSRQVVTERLASVFLSVSGARR